MRHFPMRYLHTSLFQVSAALQWDLQYPWVLHDKQEWTKFHGKTVTKM